MYVWRRVDNANTANPGERNVLQWFEKSQLLCATFHSHYVCVTKGSALTIACGSYCNSELTGDSEQTSTRGLLNGRPSEGLRDFLSYAIVENRQAKVLFR